MYGSMCRREGDLESGEIATLASEAAVELDHYRLKRGVGFAKVGLLYEKLGEYTAIRPADALTTKKPIGHYLAFHELFCALHKTQYSTLDQICDGIDTFAAKVGEAKKLGEGKALPDESLDFLIGALVRMSQKFLELS